jgi:hypothetical protein
MQQVDLEAILAAEDAARAQEKLKKPKKPTKGPKAKPPSSSSNGNGSSSNGSSKASSSSSSSSSAAASPSGTPLTGSMEMTFEEPEPVPAGVVDADEGFDQEEERRQSGSSGISSGLRLENVSGLVSPLCPPPPSSTTTVFFFHQHQAHSSRSQ